MSSEPSITAYDSTSISVKQNAVPATDKNFSESLYLQLLHFYYKTMQTAERPKDTDFL